MNQLNVFGKEGVQFSYDFIKDIRKLVKSNVDKFSIDFYRSMTRTGFCLNRFEKLKLKPYQRKQLKGYNLWRYEYRDESNLRCLFILTTNCFDGKPILLCAFNEIKGKIKGANSYNDNIERAIRIFEDINSQEVLLWLLTKVNYLM